MKYSEIKKTAISTYAAIKKFIQQNTAVCILAGGLACSTGYLYADKPVFSNPKPPKKEYRSTGEELTQLEKKVLRAIQSVSISLLVLLAGFGISYTYYNVKKDKEERLKKKNPACETPFTDKYPEYALFLMKNKGTAALCVYSAIFAGTLNLDYSMAEIGKNIGHIKALPLLSYFGTITALWKDEYKKPRNKNFARSVEIALKIRTGNASLAELNKLYDIYIDESKVDFEIASYYIKQGQILVGLDYLEKGIRNFKQDKSKLSLEDKLFLRPIIELITTTAVKSDPGNTGKRFEHALSKFYSGKFNETAESIDTIVKLNPERPDIICACAMYLDLVSLHAANSNSSELSIRLKEKAKTLHTRNARTIISQSKQNSGLLNALKSTESSVYETTLPFLQTKYILETSTEQKDQVRRKFEITKHVFSAVDDIKKTGKPLSEIFIGEELYSAYLRTQGKTLEEELAQGLGNEELLSVLWHVCETYSEILEKTKELGLNEKLVNELDYEKILKSKFAKRVTPNANLQEDLLSTLRPVIDFLSKRDSYFMHNNPHPGNIIVSPFDESTGLIDFGDSCYAEPVLDIVHLFGHHTIQKIDCVDYSQMKKKDLYANYCVDKEDFEYVKTNCQVFKFAHLLGRSLAYEEAGIEYYLQQLKKSADQLYLTNGNPLVQDFIGLLKKLKF